MMIGIGVLSALPMLVSAAKKTRCAKESWPLSYCP